MRILAIDTATEACSAALLIDTEVRERYELAPRQHANLILMMVDQLLADAGLHLGQLDALAFGRGPGGFTGVRIATGVVQGLAFGAELPVVPVSTLQMLAHGAWRELGHRQVLAAIDARMDEVYWGCYEHTGNSMDCRGGEHVGPPNFIRLPVGSNATAREGWYGVGSGWGAHAGVLAETLRERVPGLSGWDNTRFPRAWDCALLGSTGFARGEGVPAEQALPVYLRDEVAWKRADNAK